MIINYWFKVILFCGLVINMSSSSSSFAQTLTVVSNVKEAFNDKVKPIISIIVFFKNHRATLAFIKNWQHAPQIHIEPLQFMPAAVLTMLKEKDTLKKIAHSNVWLCCFK